MTIISSDLSCFAVKSNGKRNATLIASEFAFRLRPIAWSKKSFHSARVCVFIFAYQHTVRPEMSMIDAVASYFRLGGIFKLEILSLRFISVVSIYTWTITVWQVCCLVSISTAVLSVSREPPISVQRFRSELKSIKRPLANFTIAKRTTRC